MADNFTDYLGAASTVTTPYGTTPQYGLVYDLASARWINADQFRQFVRDSVQVTQRQAIQQAKASSTNQLREEELNAARMFEATRKNFGVGIGFSPGEGDNNLETGFKALGNLLGQGASFILNGPGQDLSPDDDSDYKEYAAAGGLLTKDEFMSQSPATRGFLLRRAKSHEKVSDTASQFLSLPGVEQAAEGFGVAWHGLKTGVQVVGGSGIIPAIPKDKGGSIADIFSPDEWRKEWQRTKDKSLGNAIVDEALDQWISDDKLAQWKRDNSWYQMSSLGTELYAGFFADPGVIAGKGLGAAIRVHTGELPLRGDTEFARNLTRKLQREQVTIQNPVTRKVIDWRAANINEKWDAVEGLATSGIGPAEFSRLPMFLQKSRTLNGGPAAYALHWAANYKNEFNEILNAPRTREALSGLRTQDGSAVPIPHRLDAWDLTKQLAMGDPKARAILEKLQEIPSAEMNEFAPGYGTLLDSMKALQTRADGLQSEVDDLIAKANATGEPLSPYHQWEVDTDLRIKQKQLADLTDHMQKYKGYQEWLDSAMNHGRINLQRVGITPGKRWSEARYRQMDEESETHRIFKDNPFGAVHTISRIPRGLFLNRANMAELHNVDSALMSSDRQFDQFEHFFGYAPEGAKDEFRSRLVKAKTPFDRYKIMYELEETHLVGALSHKFGIEPEVTRKILHGIYDEQNKVKEGILSGSDTMYRSAPTLMQRVKGSDPTAELVDASEDGKYLTVNLIRHGQKKETYVVPREALDTRRSPQDVTQTPNYYSPMDTRRVFLEFKRNQDVLREMNKSFLSQGQAAFMESLTHGMQKFNGLWKPLMLFRFAWPQRVLMDEAARATAIFGPNYWLTGAGADAVVKSAGNIFPNTANLFRRAKHGPLGVEMVGPGPIKNDALRNPNPFRREAEVTEAPQIPASLFPVKTKGRAAKVDAIVQAQRDYDETLRRGGEFMVGKLNPATRDPLMPGQSPLRDKLREYAIEQAKRSARVDRPHHPILDAVNDWQARQGYVSGRAKQEGPRFFDPVSGRRLKTGHFIIFDPGNSIRLTPGKIRGGTFEESEVSRRTLQEAMKWYEQNADLLSRAGVRMVVTPEGDLGLAKWFPANDKKAARAFLEFVSDAHPTVMYSPHLGENHWSVIGDPDESAWTQESYREFASDPIKEQVRGDAPLEGEEGVEVFHGTSDEMPEDLYPRQEVEPRNGQMVGGGLYTTVNEAVARSYGALNMYVIKGSKSGKRYKIFDLDQPLTEKDARDFLNWSIERERQQGFSAYAANRLIDEMHDRTYLGGAEQRHFTKAHFNDDDTLSKTWANLYEDTQDLDGASVQHALLDDFLEEVHGVGAKTHLGGTTYGNDHRVYVFLHPEDIVISPRWAPTGEYETIPYWFSNPQSVENPLPRNRILRPSKKAAPDTREPVAALENPVPPRVNAELAHVEDAEFAAADRGMDMSAMDAEIDSPTSWVLRKIAERREQGAKSKAILSSDGQSVIIPGAFEGHEGEIFRGLVKSDRAIDVLTEGSSSQLTMMRRRAAGHAVYKRPEFTDAALQRGTLENKEAVRYFQVYADMVNDHIGNSPVWGKMLDGWNDERIVNWLDRTPEGQRVLDEVKPTGMPTEVWVDDHRFMLNHYVPSRELQRRLAKGRIKPSDLRKKVPDEKLPDVYGPDFEILDRRKTAGEMAESIKNGFYRVLGSAPVDALSRQPFFKAMYDMRMKNLIGSTDAKWLSEKTIAEMQTEARNFAKQEVERHLYNLVDQNNLTDALRFVAPFWGAQWEAISKWLGIISDRPETVARFFMGQRALYQNFVVVDEDGNPVNRGTRSGGLHNLGLYHPNDRIVIPMSSWLKKALPGVDNFATMAIPIGSANTILQGDLPLMPSLGPLATIPADVFLKHVDDAYGTEHADDFWYRWMFPIGRPRDKSDIKRAIEQIAPGWIRRIMDGSDEDSQSRFNIENQIAREMITKARREGKPMPSWGDIKKTADHLFLTRSIASYVLPFQTQFLPKHQYWVDAAHRYQKEYGGDWWDKFIDDYGEEAAIYATSSTNSVGVPPTTEGMAEWKQNKELIRDYPQWANAIISPEAYMDDFNSDAYGQQLAINTGPGSTQTLRSTSDLQERLYTDPETKLGWREYRKLNAAIEAELANRGLTNIQQRGAEDLVQIKRAGIADIVAKHPSWARAYETQEQTINSDIEDLKKIAGNPIFDKRPDFQGLRQYLEIRQKFVNALDQIGRLGGSRSLQAQANAPLAAAFYNEVGQLVLQNPAFAEFYSRYLSSDTLSTGGGVYDNGND